MSDAPPVDADLVQRLAQLQNLALTDAHVPGVVANLQLISRLAAPVLAATLEPEDEPAPQWIP